MSPLQRVLLAPAVLAASLVFCDPSSASPYFQTNLVSDIPGLAQLNDPGLHNPWGMSFSATSPFWVSDQGTNTSTLYRVVNGVVKQLGLVVSIPTTGGGPQGPTGQVNNNTAAFLVNGAPANFIFANLNGTISAWNGSAGTTAQIKVPASGAVYTGLAIATAAAGPRLYAANGVTGNIDVFDGSFAAASLAAGAFAKPAGVPAGLAPFNVQNIGGRIYVTYAPPGRAAQIAAAEGQGAVAIFDTNGTLIQTLVTGSKLASPWGIALAPSSGFGGFSGDLLIGNFSFAVSEINAFDPITGAYLGTISDQGGHALINSGLWGLAFGNGTTGDAHTLYFTAGINGEVDGLFASITAIPEPETLGLLALGLPAMAQRLSRRRRRSGA